MGQPQDTQTRALEITTAPQSGQGQQSWPTTPMTAVADFRAAMQGLYLNGGGYVALGYVDSDNVLIGWREHCEGGYPYGSVAEGCDMVWECEGDDPNCPNAVDYHTDYPYCGHCQRKALEWALETWHTSHLD